MANFGLVKLVRKNVIFFKFFAGKSEFGAPCQEPPEPVCHTTHSCANVAILSDIIIIINSMQLSTEQQTLSFLSPALFFVSM
jgi:hypothetical protein